MGVPSPGEGGQRGKRGAPKPVSESRKVRKPLMEKRRRDRINVCLTTLSTLLKDGEGGDTSTDASSTSAAGKKRVKLEKADILEQTVTYFHGLSERRKRLKEAVQHPTDAEKRPQSSYILGYESCIQVADSFLKELGHQNGSEEFRNNLNKFLSDKLSSQNAPDEASLSEGDKIVTQNGAGNIVTLVPKLLSDGSCALVVRGEHEEECGLGGNSSHISSCSDTKNDNFPLTSSDEVSDDELDEAQLISECLKEDDEDDGEEVWRPWDDFS